MNFRGRFAILIIGIALFLGTSSAPSVLTTEAILELVNQDRVEHGLSVLVSNPTLNLAAYAKAKDMLEKNYFGHTSPDGTQPWHWLQTLGYRYSYAGENLAEGFSDAKDLENSWMASPKHRANILSPFYSDQGLAIVSDGHTNIVVQFLGSKENLVSLGE